MGIHSNHLVEAMSTHKICFGSKIITSYHLIWSYGATVLFYMTKLIGAMVNNFKFHTIHVTFNIWQNKNCNFLIYFIKSFNAIYIQNEPQIRWAARQTSIMNSSFNWSRKHTYIILTPLNPLLYSKSKTGVYRDIHYFSYFCSKHKLWVLVRSNEYPQSMFWAEIWKISELFIWKFSVSESEIFYIFEQACFRNGTIIFLISLFFVKLTIPQPIYNTIVGIQSKTLLANFSFFFLLIWILRSFKNISYIKPIVHQRWVKTGEPEEKPPDHP